jgi:hypothetical protein
MDFDQTSTVEWMAPNSTGRVARTARSVPLSPSRSSQVPNPELAARRESCQLLPASHYPSHNSCQLLPASHYPSHMSCQLPR